MTFTAGAFLLGTLFALIPIIIHLIYRRQARIIEYPSLMFFKLISKRVSRRQNLRELLILLLRIAAIAFLALALANPVLTGLGYLGGASSAVVIVLDDSYSMQQKQEAETVFERAKRKAFDILASLQARDETALIFLSDIKTGKAPDALSTNIEEIKDKLLKAKVSNTSATLFPALKRAKKLLSETAMPNRECYVISDFRNHAFANYKEEDLSDFPAKCFAIELAAKELPSFALTKVETVQPKLIKNSPAQIVVEAVNYADKPVNAVLELHLLQSAIEDDSCVFKAAGERIPVQLPPEAQKFSLKLRINPENKDVLAGFVSLKTAGEETKNDIALDNIRFFAFTVGDKEPVLIVNGEPSDVLVDDEVYYLSAALKPEDTSSLYEPAIVKPAEVDFSRLSEYRAVFFCNVERPFEPDDKTALDKLKNYVREGGLLFFFPGDKVSPEFYNKIFERDDPANSLLPAKFLKFAGEDFQGEHFAVMKSLPINNPLFINLQQLQPEKIRFSEFFKLAITDKDIESDKLLEFSTNDVCLVSKAIGLGKVFLFAFPADREWTNFPLRKLYPILIRRLLKFSKIVDATISPADIFRLKLRKSLGITQVTVLPPPRIIKDDKGVKPKPIIATPVGEDKTLFVFPVKNLQRLENSTDTPGIYFYQTASSNFRSKYRAFTVNPETREAEPSLASSDKINALTPQTSVIALETDLREFIKKRREGTSIWWLLFIIAIAALLLESLLANSKLPGLKKEQLTGTLQKLRETGVALQSVKTESAQPKPAAKAESASQKDAKK